jgi:hypothetical protein
MARTEFEFELTGLKIRYKGDRTGLPKVIEKFRSNFGGLIGSSEALDLDVDANDPQRRLIFDAPAVAAKGEEEAETKGRKPAKRNKSNGSPANQAAIDWTHDPGKWGNPRQEWGPTEKGIWLLYVVANETNAKNLAPGALAATFNKHFSESGPIRASNISRDFKRAKRQTPPAVHNDTTVDPPTWFLTQAGKQLAESLVAQARGLSQDS